MSIANSAACQVQLDNLLIGGYQDLATAQLHYAQDFMGEFDKVLDYKGAVQGSTLAQAVGTASVIKTVQPLAFVPTEVYPQ